MLYQVRLNLFLTSEGTARGLYNHCLGVFPQATSINSGQPNAEFSIIELIENHHDTNPAEPCSLIDHETNQPA